MPYMIPKFKLKLGGLWVKAVVSIKVNLSRRQPVDTAEIKLPFHAEFDLDVFREQGAAVGSEVVVKLGYTEPEPSLVFTGVITKVSTDQPLVIKCEDHGHELKKARVTKTYSERNIYGPLGIPETWHSAIAHHLIGSAGLTPVVPVYGVESEGDFLRKTFNVDKQTVGQVLDKFRETGWDWFVIPGTRRCYFGPGWPFAQGILPQKTRHVFTFGKAYQHAMTLEHLDHLPNIISSDLAFAPAKKVGKVVVYATDRDFQGLAVKGEYGEGEPVLEFDMDGSTDGNTQTAVNARAWQLYQQYTSHGLTQGFKAIGAPEISHSQSVKVSDPAHGERSDNYWIDEVEHEYGPEAGFVTQITLAEREESG